MSKQLTLAEIKRRLVKGARATMTWHRMPGPKTALNETREVVAVQTTAIAFRTRDGGMSWLYWPRADEVRIDGPDSFTVLCETDRQPLMSYRIEQGERDGEGKVKGGG